jgi:predicted dehydrogenase
MTTSTKKLRVGVIGLGFVSVDLKHLLGLRACSDLCDIVAFCDIDEERAAAASRDWGSSDAYATTDYQRLLQDPSIDVIHVCTWNASHAEITVAALEAGKHVMCEKPMAVTSAEAQQMVDAAERTGKLLTIGYQNRFRADVRHIRQRIDQGDLGEIYLVRAHAVRRRGVPTWGVFTDKEKQGGGALIDIGTHALDLALWFMGDYDVASVSGTTFDKLRDKPEGNPGGPWDPATMDVEESAVAMIRMKSGAVIYLEAAWALNDKNPREAACTLMGTEGGAEIEMSNGAYHPSYNSVEAGLMTVTEPGGSGGFSGAQGSAAAVDLAEREARQWLGAVLGDGEPLVKPREALVVTQILEAVYDSARSGREVTF